jgi:carboxymethylenebutenolidase
MPPLLIRLTLKLTGGIGRKELTDFYRDHFIFSNPEGTALELISRTVGVDRVVDEFIFKLNHNRVVDWLYDSTG